MDELLRQRRFWIIIVIGALIGVGIAWLTTPGRGPLNLLPGQDSTWRAVQSRGTWRVGMDPSFPPFQALDEQGQPIGYDVDLARAMGELWGVQTEIVAIGYDSLLDALQTGQVDTVISALPYDPRETKDFRFSEPYFEAGIRLSVPVTSSIADAEALDAQTLAVEWGSSGDMLGRQLQRNGIAVELAQYPTPAEVIQAVAAGADGVDAALVDNVTLREAQGDGVAIVAVGPPLESNPYVIASPYRAPQLAAQIQDALATLNASGRMTELENRWFGPTDLEQAATSATP